MRWRNEILIWFPWWMLLNPTMDVAFWYALRWQKVGWLKWQAGMMERGNIRIWVLERMSFCHRTTARQSSHLLRCIHWSSNVYYSILPTHINYGFGANQSFSAIALRIHNFGAAQCQTRASLTVVSAMVSSDDISLPSTTCNFVVNSTNRDWFVDRSTDRRENQVVVSAMVSHILVVNSTNRDWLLIEAKETHWLTGA